MLNDTPARKLHRLSKVRMAFDLASNNFIYLLPNTASCVGCFGKDLVGSIRQRKYPNNFRVHERTNSLREMFYTLFHELFSTFFSNIIGLPERRNKRKSVLKIVKKAPPFKKNVLMEPVKLIVPSLATPLVNE